MTAAIAFASAYRGFERDHSMPTRVGHAFYWSTPLSWPWPNYEFWFSI